VKKLFDYLTGSSDLKRAIAFLDAERHFILNGELARLTELGNEREAVLKTVQQNVQNISEELKNDLIAIQSKAKRNAELLRACMEGVAEARVEIDKWRAEAENIGTYSPDGVTPNVVKKPRTDKRA
jgi:hypothetical protein